MAALHAWLHIRVRGYACVYLLWSHQYVYDVERAVNAASAWFSSNYPNGARTKDLIVFDIDETVLSNFNDLMRQLDTGKRNSDDQDAGLDPAIPAMLKLYSELFNKGFSVTFLTGRRNSLRAASEQNLYLAGYGKQCPQGTPDEPRSQSMEPCYVQLDMREEDDTRIAHIYKSDRRKRLQDRGFEIVVCFGTNHHHQQAKAQNTAAHGTRRAPQPDLTANDTGTTLLALADVAPHAVHLNAAALGRGLNALAIWALMLGGRAAAAQMSLGAMLHAPGAGRRLLQQQPYCSEGTTPSCTPCPALPTVGNDPCHQLGVPAPSAAPLTGGVHLFAAASPTAIQSAATTCASYAPPYPPVVPPPTVDPVQHTALPLLCRTSTTQAMQTLKQSDRLGIAMINPRGWLEVQGNHFLLNGATWRGHGVNMLDTGFNNAACASAPESTDNLAGVPASEAIRLAEVNRRIDAAVSYGANYIRLLMDTRPLGEYTITDGIYNDVRKCRLLTDDSYFNSIIGAVNHASSHDGVYIDLSLFTNPGGAQSYNQDNITPATLTSTFVPSAASNPIWQKLATQFAKNPRVIFGLANEPGNRNDTASLQAANDAVLSNIDAIRQAERAAGAPGQHLIKVPPYVVKGLPWGRDLGWWGAHPIARSNVIYSIHPYELADKTMNGEILPYRALPIVVDEFAPNLQEMRIADAMSVAAALESQVPPIPYVAWHFAPSDSGLFEPVTSKTNACGLNDPLTQRPEWGTSYLNWQMGVAIATGGIVQQG